MEQHSGGHNVRRFRWMVRPSNRTDSQPVAWHGGRTKRRRSLRRLSGFDSPAWSRFNQRARAGPPRPRSTPATARCLSMGAEKLRGPSVTDQSSVLRFIEDNFLGGQRIGQGSFDAMTNSIAQMFDFNRDDDEQGKLFLDPSTGEPID